MCSFPNLEPVYCSMFGSIFCFLTCIQISQEAGKMVWYSHVLENFPKFVVIHTVKGCNVVSEAEYMFFWNYLAFSMINDFLDMRGDKHWTHKIGSWQYPTIWRLVLPVFFRAQLAHFCSLACTPFSGVWKISSCSSTWFSPFRGRWQVPICSWQDKVLFLVDWLAALWISPTP